MKKEFDITTFDNLDSFIKELKFNIVYPCVILLYGNLGAGKTTLTSRLSKILGVKEGVVSPTYFFMREYEILDGKKLLHIDTYRMKDESKEFDNIEILEAIFDNDGIVIIEWPIENIVSKIRKVKNVISLELENLNDNKRIIKFIN